MSILSNTRSIRSIFDNEFPNEIDQMSNEQMLLILSEETHWELFKWTFLDTAEAIPVGETTWKKKKRKETFRDTAKGIVLNELLNDFPKKFLQYLGDFVLLNEF